MTALAESSGAAGPYVVSDMEQLAQDAAAAVARMVKERGLDKSMGELWFSLPVMEDGRFVLRVETEEEMNKRTGNK